MAKRIAILLISIFICSCADMDSQQARWTLPIDSPARAGLEEAKTDNATGKGAAVDDENATESLLKSVDIRADEFNDKLQGFTTETRYPGSGRSPLEEVAEAGDREKLSLELFDADLIDVIRLFMSVLKDNYSVQPGVVGKVTLQVNDSFDKQQILDLLQGILRMHSATMIFENGIWEIMPLQSAPSSLSSSALFMPGERAGPSRGQIIQGFRLKYAAASELVNVLQPYLSKGALIYANDPEGVLLVCDYPHVINKVSRLLTLFDVSVFADLNMKVFGLKYALAEDVAKELEAISKSVGILDVKGTSGVHFVPLDRLNMIVVMSKNRQVLDFTGAWIEELDRDQPEIIKEEQEENVYVYYCQNGDASEIVDALEGIFSGKDEKKSSDEKDEDEPLPLGKQLDTMKAETALKQDVEVKNKQFLGTKGVSGELSGPVSFVVDETTNTILVRCIGGDYTKIEQVIKKLDIYPKQVLIEVVIAEVSLDDSTKLGVEWQYIFDLDGDATATLGVDNNLGIVNAAASSTAIASGLGLVVAGNRLTGALKAFAEDNKVQILSSPHILTSNHKEAKINVGEEVPIVTSEMRTTEATSTGTTVDKTIQYRDTGIILTVTPHINDKGLVRLEIEQEVSDISNTVVEGVSSPVFSNRVASSTLVVNSEQTVIIGGLIKHSRTNSQTGIPVLGRVPILKYLFGYEGHAYQGQELLIFITPHVIESRKDADTLSSGFIKRLEELKATMR